MDVYVCIHSPFLFYRSIKDFRKNTVVYNKNYNDNEKDFDNENIKVKVDVQLQ